MSDNSIKEKTNIEQFNEENEKYAENEIIEMEYYVCLLNIFQTYYKKFYNKPEDEDLFFEVDIEKETSTNRSMELLYEYLHEYKINKEKGDIYTKLYDESIDESKFDDIYCLLLDYKIHKISPSFLSLIIYLIDLDWENISWTITKIKGEL